MSLAAMNWAFMQKLAPTKKMILVALADHCDDEGKCWPGIKNIAKKASVSKRTLQRALTELESEGFLRIEERRRENNSQQSNMYYLKKVLFSFIRITLFTEIRAEEDNCRNVLFCSALLTVLLSSTFNSFTQTQP